jgi:ABC-type sulfate transport system permease subunit
MLQTVIRLIYLGATTVFALVELVFASMTISALRDQTNYAISDSMRALTYTLNERIVHSAIMLGMSIMVIALAILSFVYGVLAYAKISRDVRQGKDVLRSTYAYDNAALRGY